ncbi:MAG TPA: hypothetical protein VIJ65_08790 [Acidobacteriaceae bacterium]
MKQVTSTVTYFAEEGKANLSECLRLSFETLVEFGLETLVIFTGVGEGIQQAIDQFLDRPEYAHIRIVGVTFAQGFEVRREGVLGPHVFPAEVKAQFLSRGIPLIRAHLPFDSISAQYQQHGAMGQDMSIVGNALNIFCGSMNLCVQALMMACDAGEVEIGEHVVVMTSDTALLARAAPTSRLLTDLIVRQIICKPAFLTIAKSEKRLGEPTGEQLTLNGVIDENEDQSQHGPVLSR